MLHQLAQPSARFWPTFAFAFAFACDINRLLLLPSSTSSTSWQNLNLPLNLHLRLATIGLGSTWRHPCSEDLSEYLLQLWHNGTAPALASTSATIRELFLHQLLHLNLPTMRQHWQMSKLQTMPIDQLSSLVFSGLQQIPIHHPPTVQPLLLPSEPQLHQLEPYLKL